MSIMLHTLQLCKASARFWNMYICMTGRNGQEKIILPFLSRVARWYIFNPKIPIWVNFGASCNARCWYILCPFGLFTAIWYILWPFRIIYGHLVYFFLFWYICCAKKNLATLHPILVSEIRRNPSLFADGKRLRKLFWRLENFARVSPGLPDGIFANTKILLWVNFVCRALEWEMLVYFWPSEEKFTAAWYFYGPLLGIICDNLECFGMLHPAKSGNPVRRIFWHCGHQCFSAAMCFGAYVHT
jgi:hypothetical protein